MLLFTEKCIILNVNIRILSEYDVNPRNFNISLEKAYLSKQITCSGSTKQMAAGFPSNGTFVKASTVYIGMSMTGFCLFRISSSCLIGIDIQ